MSIAELKGWLVFIQDAPANIRDYLTGLVWLLVALLLIWAILKLLFNQQFKQLYSVLGTGAKLAGKMSKVVAKEAVKSLQLPEPYPRVARFFAIVFMLNSYAASATFACIFLFVGVLTVLSNTASFWGRTGALAFAMVLLFAAFFFFADAERDRVRLFKGKANNDD